MPEEARGDGAERSREAGGREMEKGRRDVLNSG
jgi:hypothetical protein